MGLGATEDIIKQSKYNLKLYFSTEITQLTLLYPRTSGTQKHEHLTHHHLGNAKNSTRRQQDIKKNAFFASTRT